MKNTDEKLQYLAEKIHTGKTIKVAILGLGSVGNYLLNYLNSWDFDNVDIYIGSKSPEKAEKDVNISKVAAIIRNGKSKNIYIKTIDLNNIESITSFIKDVSPDFIVNSSRVYTGLKYGSISWNTIRAYGLWAPLSVRYIKNIMEAHEIADSKAIVINTSYSDVVIPWLKSAGMRFPDFGSGNLNHLIPRIKMAVADYLNINDMENIDVTLSTSHFHDVVISKEGQDEGVPPLININYKGEKVSPDMKKIWKNCAITMPSDSQRNMMNASSNFEIIKKISCALKNKDKQVIHAPGVGGNIGGYPVVINGETASIKFKETYFSLDEMKKCNSRSIYLDGIAGVKDGILFYTNELLEKVKKQFNVQMPKSVKLSEVEQVAGFIIENIIEKRAEK